MNTWSYIASILGPGLHWGHSAEKLQSAIRQAKADHQPDAAEHLRIILELRNRVMCEDPDKKPFGRPQKGQPESLIKKISTAYKFWWDSSAPENCLRFLLIILACLIWGSWWAIPVGILATFLWLK